MKLTIIPSDGAVYENGVCYSGLTWDGTPPDVHALQYDTDLIYGWIEFNDGKPNEDIFALPQWALNAEAAWTEANKPPAPPGPPTAEENKQTAIGFLAATDWVNQPDVRNTAVVPHLVNGNEFDAYRIAVRQYAVTPIAGEIAWPTKPDEVWVTA
jgi:hypothetical protein